MALMDFLGGLGGAMMGGPQNMMFGLAGQQQGINPMGLLGQFLGIPDLVKPMKQAEAPPVVGTPGINPDAPQPTSAPATHWQIGKEYDGMTPSASAAPQPSAPAAPAYEKPSGFRSFLGNLGDALLIGAGASPIFKPGEQRKQLGADLAAYLGSDNPELASIFAKHPEAGMQLYNALREDKRFDRTAGQDDRRIGVAEGQLGLGRDELGERRRANQAGETLTQRGQDISSTTQVRLQQMRQQEAAAGRAHDAALRAGDRQHAERMLGLQQQFQREIAQLTNGGDAGTVTETVTYPGTEAKEGGWFSDPVAATPERKVVTKRPANAPQQTGYSQQDLEYTAKKHGITVEEVKRRLGVN